MNEAAKSGHWGFSVSCYCTVTVFLNVWHTFPHPGSYSGRLTLCSHGHVRALTDGTPQGMHSLVCSNSRNSCIHSTSIIGQCRMETGTARERESATEDDNGVGKKASRRSTNDRFGGSLRGRPSSTGKYSSGHCIREHVIRQRMSIQERTSSARCCDIGSRSRVRRNRSPQGRPAKDATTGARNSWVNDRTCVCVLVWQCKSSCKLAEWENFIIRQI